MKLSNKQCRGVSNSAKLSVLLIYKLCSSPESLLQDTIYRQKNQQIDLKDLICLITI